MALDGQEAIVTGGNRGIGKAIVEVLLECGASVLAIGSDSQRLASLAHRHSGTGRIETLRVDLADNEDVEAAARRLSGRRTDILINNAGINFHALTGDIDLAAFDNLMRINVRAPVALFRSLVPRMADRGYGRVVNISSIFSQVSKARRSSYTASKFALAGFTRALA